MSDLDGYLPDDACSRCGEDHQDCECPSDLDQPDVCDHGKTVGEWCARCDVAGEEALSVALARALARRQEDDDETLGAALAARFQKG